MTEKLKLDNWPPFYGFHTSIYVKTEFINDLLAEVDLLVVGTKAGIREANPLERLALLVLDKDRLISFDIEASE